MSDSRHSSVGTEREPSAFDDWLKCVFCGSEQAVFKIIDTWDPDTGDVLEKRPALKCENCGHTKYTDTEERSDRSTKPDTDRGEGER